MHTPHTIILDTSGLNPVIVSFTSRVQHCAFVRCAGSVISMSHNSKLASAQSSRQALVEVSGLAHNSSR